MAEVPQANPCIECPFRRGSAAGWLGPHEHVTEIINILNADQKFPCHVRVNAILQRELPTAEERKSDEFAEYVNGLAPFCTGAIAYMNNSCKQVRHPDAKHAADMIGRRKDVFRDGIELQAYHHGFDGVRVSNLPVGMQISVPRERVVEWLTRTDSPLAKTDGKEPLLAAARRKIHGNGPRNKKARAKGPKTTRVQPDQIVQRRQRKARM